MIEETARHAGYADIIGEQIDGSAGRRPAISLEPDATRAIRGIAVNRSNSIAGSLTLARLANLAVRAGSGCPREGFKKARK
jgi:hypothetical protein